MRKGVKLKHPPRVKLYMKDAVAIFKSTYLDMADCIIAAQSSKEYFASFDKELLGIKNIKSFWK